MDTLRIRWTGGEATFEPGTAVRIGRELDAEVQPTNTNVSRRHAEVTHSPSGWVLRDVGSAQGTWRDGRKVQTVDVRGTVQVTLGREGRGEVLTLEASVAAPRSTGAGGIPGPGASPGATELPGHGGPSNPTQIVGPGQMAPAAAGEGTVIVGAGASNRPGGPLRADAVEGATVVTGDVLHLECAGRSYSFRPGQDVSIGRDAGCDVVSSNPTVSRRHARLSHDGSGWTLHDEGSSGGTYVDGRRVTEQPLAGSVAAWLGDDTTGERVVLVASGTNPTPKKSRRSPLRPAALPITLATAGIVVAVLIVGWLVVAGVLGGGPSDEDLERATVRLVAGDYAGSGTIIDAEQGLILTNAHVVAPDAPGSAVRDVSFGYLLDPSPREVEVLVAPASGKDAEPRFVAEVVAVDGYLDLAVLKITETFGGRIIEPDSGDLDDLVEVAVGDSTELSTGDDIRVFGFPGAAQTSSVTLTEGVVSGQVKDERMESNRGMLNISADISPGNSGGLAVNGSGQLVGVPSLVREDEVASMRPSEFAVDLIDAARRGENYESPWIRPLTTETINDITIVAPDTAEGIRFDCSTGELSSLAEGGVGVSFTFDGFTPGTHQDLLVVVRVGDSILGLWTLDLEYPVEWPSESGCATVSVAIDTADLPAESTADLSVEVGLGPDYESDW